jgi:hypothetical protein
MAVMQLFQRVPVLICGTFAIEVINCLQSSRREQ